MHKVAGGLGWKVLIGGGCTTTFKDRDRGGPSKVAFSTFDLHNRSFSDVHGLRPPITQSLFLSTDNSYQSQITSA